MSISRNMMMAAAGNAGGAGGLLAIEDVFSTYLYTGNGFGQTINNGINLGTKNAGPSLEFDGVNDFLSRSSDLSGNTDGKQVTLSAWISPQNSGSWTIYSTDSFKFTVYGNSDQLLLVGRNTSNNNVISAEITSSGLFSGGKWHHILISFDLANNASKHVYVNDTAVNMSWNSYINDDIDFTNSIHYIGDRVSGGYRLKSYLSNVLLDYTYRDISIEANRRLFITEDLTPALGQESLSPIIYLPMTNSAGGNSGTGGDFTVNGNPKIEAEFGPFEAPSAEGGLVWTKGRSNTRDNWWNDSERGVAEALVSNSTGAESTRNITSFNTNGYTTDPDFGYNASGETFVSWTFRKAPRFFDVVTYTGDGVAGRAIPHNLGVEPGMIVVKRTDTAGFGWGVYHRSLPNGQVLQLQSSSGAYTDTFWNSTSPTAGSFIVGDNSWINASGGTYVAYLFAHDPLGPSGDGSDGLISCGSFTTDGSGNATVDLGWEPQWVLSKRTAEIGASWQVVDSMRGFSVTSPDPILEPNTSRAEQQDNWATITSTGFTGPFSSANQNYIYVAIRRGPMRQPTSGTEVFTSVTKSVDNTFTSTGHVVDLLIESKRTSPNTTFQHLTLDRLRGINVLTTFSTAAEYVGVVSPWFSSNTGFNATNFYAPTAGDYLFWSFRRAPGFFDVVAYTGGITPNIPHNLGVIPEMYIVKCRTDGASNRGWAVYHKDYDTSASYIKLDSSEGLIGLAGVWGTGPSETTFGVGNGYSIVNESAQNYIAYLFATLPGISKVGSYTGNGSSQTIDCGFTSGARFILIKRTDSAGDWYVWDTARGIVASNDPHLSLNTTAAEVTTDDSVDPESSGFIVNQVAATNINVSSGEYIFLAIS